VAEHDGLTFAPVFVINLRTVFDSNHVHGILLGVLLYGNSVKVYRCCGVRQHERCRGSRGSSNEVTAAYSVRCEVRSAHSIEPIRPCKVGFSATLESSNSLGYASIREVAAETELYSGFVQCGLCKEELMLRIGISVETDDDLGPRDRVTYAVVKGVAEFL
jgi:hypothetical protein